MVERNVPDPAAANRRRRGERVDAVVRGVVAAGNGNGGITLQGRRVAYEGFAQRLVDDQPAKSAAVDVEISVEISAAPEPQPTDETTLIELHCGDVVDHMLDTPSRCEI